MHKNLIVLLILVLSQLHGFCDNNWNVNLISDSLKFEADAVVRNYSVKYHRSSIDKYSMDVHYVVTILNKGGASSAQLLINYDKNSAVDNLEINLYDEQGNEIRKVKKKEIQDYAYNSSYTMFSDNRVKYFKASSNIYPFTFEYVYTIEYDGFVGVRPWMPQNQYDVSTEYAELTFEVPIKYDINIKELNHDFEFECKEEEGNKIYQWKAHDIKAISWQPMSPDYLEIFSAVLISPGQISYEGSVGDFSSWESYGKWVYSLIESRDELSEETVAKIKAITDTISSKKEKVKAVYQYMQNKTRYVNIAYGIGGFQPILASDVDEKGYGDCKALSNYTKALLKCIDIEAHYTEIGNGSNQKIKFPDFPTARQTNHVILCVPMAKDTVWLECTSQNVPFGYIWGSNSDRWALLVKKDGGELVRTPTYHTNENTRHSTIKVNLDADGNAKTHLKTAFENYIFEDIYSTINSSPKDQRKSLLKEIDANSLNITNFAVKNESTDSAKATLNLSGGINKYAVKSGKRLFIEPNFLIEESYPSNISNDRKTVFYQSVGYCYSDSIVINYPQNMEVEYLPKMVNFNSAYGSYCISYQQLDKNQLLISRFVQINQGKFEPSEFTEIDLFLNRINKQEKEKIILNGVG
ncbi:DUF3857 domain-containing protein [Sunxiuqinia sp. A32]|uniref:DUF3857 domain-containing protein n=1 Tax=Sunxiuqinia sp. A32 TaxID=3461496 RepID=UPI0040458B5B